MDGDGNTLKLDGFNNIACIARCKKNCIKVTQNILMVLIELIKNNLDNTPNV